MRIYRSEKISKRKVESLILRIHFYVQIVFRGKVCKGRKGRSEIIINKYLDNYHKEGLE